MDDIESLLETINILADKEAMEGIKKSLRDIADGKIISFEELFDDSQA